MTSDYLPISLAPLLNMLHCTWLSTLVESDHSFQEGYDLAKVLLVLASHYYHLYLCAIIITFDPFYIKGFIPLSYKSLIEHCC